MRAIVVIGGEAPYPAVAAHLAPVDLVVAADSGLDAAVGLGLRPDVVVGDLDSVSPSALATAEAAGTTIERHPSDKDATDVELAVDAATARGATAITVVGGLGDRLDHLLGTLAVLGAPRLARIAVDAWLGRAWLAALQGPGQRDVDGRPGDYISLVPLAGPARGVRTQGLRWPLDDALLTPTSTLGISNELLRGRAEVRLAAGSLLVIRPYALDSR